MGLGLNTESSGGGNFMPICKYNAKAGRIYRVDRAQGADGSWETKEPEITAVFQAVFDMEGIEVGWAAFRAGMAPDFRLVPLGQPLPARPEGENDKGKPLYGQCFRLHMKLGKAAGGDVRELSSSARVVIGALDALHSQYEAEKAQHPGQLPVITLGEPIPMISSGQGQTSTNYAPVFNIAGWVDRPEDLQPKAAAPAQSGNGASPVVVPLRPAPVGAPASSGPAQPVGPPQALAAPQAAPAVVDFAEEF